MDVLDRVIALQKRHVVRPVGDGDVVRCEQDGIRVHPIKGGWRHDTPEIVALNREAFGTAVTGAERHVILSNHERLSR